MALAKEMIREFKNKFEKIMEEEDGDQVYQIQVQFFPLTKKASDLADLQSKKGSK